MNIKTFIVSLLLIVTCTSIKAWGVIPISDGEDVAKVLDLPMQT